MKNLILVIFLFVMFLGACTGKSKLSNSSTANILTTEFETLALSGVQNDNGIWWGENKSKIIRSSDKIFSVTIDKDLTGRPYVITMFERDISTKILTLGITFSASTAPDMLIDSNNFVHIIAFEPFATSPYDGKYVHYKMDTANTVTGSFTKIDAGVFLPSSANSTTSDIGSIYGSAAIDSSDNIYLVYNNTLSNFSDAGPCVSGSTDAAGPHSLGLRVYNGTIWAYEDVTTTLSTRNAYPKVVVSNDYIHIASVEDEFKSSLRSDTSTSAATNNPYCDYAYLYGEIHHFSRSINGTSWTHTTPLNLNSSRTVNEAYDMNLRLKDIEVTGGKAYLLYEMKDEARSAVVGTDIQSIFLAELSEGTTTWTHSHLHGNDTSPFLELIDRAKFFVDNSGVLFTYFEGLDLDTALNSGGANLEYSQSIKNILNGDVQKYITGSSSNQSYEIFALSPSNGSYLVNGETHLMLYPRSDSNLIQVPQLLKLSY